MSSKSFESTPAAAMPWQNLFVTTLHGHVLEGDSKAQACMENATKLIQELKEEINTLTERENVSNARLTKMEADWAESKQVQQAQHLGLRELNASLKQLLLSLQQNQADTQEKCQGVVVGLVAEKTALLQHVAELKRQHEIDVGTIGQNQIEAHAFGEQMAQMKQEIARLTEKNHASSQKVMDVQKLADARLNDITLLEDRYANLQSVDTARQGHIQTLETQIANLGLQLEAALRNDQEHLELFNTTHLALEEKMQLIDEKDGQINSLLNQNAILARDYHSKTEQMQTKDDEITRLQAQINTLKVTNGNIITGLKTANHTQTQTILNLNYQNSVLLVTIKNAKQNLLLLKSYVGVVQDSFKYDHGLRAGSVCPTKVIQKASIDHISNLMEGVYLL